MYGIKLKKIGFALQEIGYFRFFSAIIACFAKVKIFFLIEIVHKTYN